MARAYRPGWQPIITKNESTETEAIREGQRDPGPLVAHIRSHMHRHASAARSEVFQSVMRIRQSIKGCGSVPELVGG